MADKPPADDEMTPKGTPNSDRHAAETVHHDHDDAHETSPKQKPVEPPAKPA